MFSNYMNPKGIFKSVKEDFGPLNKRIALGMSPALIATANGLNNIAGIPTFAYNAVPVSAYHATHPFDEKKEEPVALPAAATA